MTAANRSLRSRELAPGHVAGSVGSAVSDQVSPSSDETSTNHSPIRK